VTQQDWVEYAIASFCADACDAWRGQPCDCGSLGRDEELRLAELNSRTRVVHVKDRLPGAVYVGRRQPWVGLAQSPFANPFPITPESDRATVIARFREHLLGSPALLRRLPELRGRPLACWCRRDGEPRTEANACHADALVELLAAHTDGELRAMAQRAAGRR